MAISVKGSIKSYSGDYSTTVNTKLNTPTITGASNHVVTVSSNKVSIKANASLDATQEKEKYSISLTPAKTVWNHFGPSNPSSDSTKDNQLKITMLDVYSGDCIVIQTPSIPGSASQTIFFDTGNSVSTEHTSELVKAALKDLSISVIDKVIITHPHIDHDGNLTKLINNTWGVSVKAVYINGFYVKDPVKVYHDLCDKKGVSFGVLRAKNYSTSVLVNDTSKPITKGTRYWLRESISSSDSKYKKIPVYNTLDFGGGVTFTCLWPTNRHIDIQNTILRQANDLNPTYDDSYFDAQQDKENAVEISGGYLEKKTLTGSISGTISSDHSLSATLSASQGNYHIKASLGNNHTAKDWIKGKFTGLTVAGQNLDKNALGYVSCFFPKISTMANKSVGGTINATLTHVLENVMTGYVKGTITCNGQKRVIYGRPRNDSLVGMEDEGVVETNSTSITGKLTYKNFSMLLTGDLSTHSFLRIIDLYDKSEYACTIMKSAHHGINNAQQQNNDSISMSQIPHNAVLFTCKHSGATGIRNSDGSIAPTKKTLSTLEAESLPAEHKGDTILYKDPYISTMHAHIAGAKVPYTNLFATRFNQKISVTSDGYNYKIYTQRFDPHWVLDHRKSIALGEGKNIETIKDNDQQYNYFEYFK